MSKHTFLWGGKAFLSAVIAFIILTGFCMFYYNVPVHYDTIDGATDYSWEKNKFYSRGTEGFAWGKTNNEGYLNPIDYTESTKIDILIMGTSHMEGYNVLQNQTTAGILASRLPDKTVYNIGTSGHNFLICADNLVNAVNKYEPKEYVIIEITSLEYSDTQLQDAIDEKVTDLTSSIGGVLELLQKNPFLRLAYSQLKMFTNNAMDDVAPSTSSAIIGSEENYYSLFAKLSKTVRDKGAQLIIVYHPNLMLNKDGSASTTSNKEFSEFFAACCEKNKIIFKDMSSRFLECYESEKVLPHGFSNTSIGAGHLNKNGHAMIAESLYEIMKEGE